MMQKIIALALLVAAVEGSSTDASIYIIRHGEKNSYGDLSSIGQTRAKCVATRFPSSEYNKPTALFAGHYSGSTPQRTLHTIQPTADNLGLNVDVSFHNSDHSGAAEAFLAEVAKGNTVMAAWEHCNIRKTCYALASQSMCDQAFTTGESDCDWWEKCSGCSDHYDGVVSFTVKSGRVTAVEHHHEDCKNWSPSPSPPPSPSPFSGKYQVGDHVEGLYKDGIWYAATIVKINSDGTYTLEWADGGTQDTVKPESKIRPSTSPSPSPASKYQVGELVEGLYKDGYWYKATIVQINSDGTYTLKWADGGTHDTVKPESKIRKYSQNVGNASSVSVPMMGGGDGDGASQDVVV